MSRQDPTAAEKARDTFGYIVQTFIVPGILGFIAMTFIAYVFPAMFTALSDGTSFAVALDRAGEKTSERLGIFLHDFSQFPHSLGLPLMGSIIGIIIAIAKSED